MKRLFRIVTVALCLAPVAGGQENKSGSVAIFLLDASLGSDTEAFSRRREHSQKILEADKSIEKFNILVFDIAGRWVEPNKLLTNDADNRKSALDKLADIVPEGACDIASSLARLTTPFADLEKGKAVRIFLLSEGWVFLGESDPNRLAATFHATSAYPARFTCLTRKAGSGNTDLLDALEAKAADKKTATVHETYTSYLAQVTKRVKLFEGKHGEHVKLLVKALSDKDFVVPPIKTEDKIARSGDLPKVYLDGRAENLFGTETYLKEAKRRGDAGDPAGMARVLTSLLPLHPTNIDVHRSVGYRLLDAKQPTYAVRLFERVQRHKPEEPHSYRDLARAFEDAGLHGLAAVQYEILLAGAWSNKYTASFKEVVQEEYAHMMRDAIRRKAAPAKLIDLFGERLEAIDASKLQADLRVTISWNTDNTDVDLWVIEPGGEKCFYGHQKTSNGGELTQDVTQGYGPERYQMIKAKPGEYRIAVHFYSGPRNQQVVEGTHVNVVVRRNAGTPQEESQRHTVILRRTNDLVEVVRMKY